MTTPKLPTIRFTVDDLMLMTKIILQKKGIKFKESAHTEELYTIISEYFNNDKSFELRGLKTKEGIKNYSLRKGLLLMGGTGIGKTFVFDELLPKAFKKMPHIKYRKTTPEAIRNLFTEHDGRALDVFDSLRLRKHENLREPSYHLYIDDIGIEGDLQEAVHFGSKHKYMRKLFEKRYIVSQIPPSIIDTPNKHCYLTHGTTNLSVSELKELYNDDHNRTWSRIKALFNFVPVVTDIDFRDN